MCHFHVNKRPFLHTFHCFKKCASIVGTQSKLKLVNTEKYFVHCDLHSGSGKQPKEGPYKKKGSNALGYRKGVSTFFTGF